jgi:hypothetical protein
MSDTDWYAEASLYSDAHVFCAGTLAQCVRKWTRLSEMEKANSAIRLGNRTGGHEVISNEKIAILAGNPIHSQV